MKQTKQYMIMRKQRFSGRNTRFLTTFGSFRYKAELQGGEEFVVVPYNKATKFTDKFRKESYQVAKDLKKKLGSTGKSFRVVPGFFFGVKEV